MATASIDLKIIKRTQDVLTPIIKKPPLTEKHLSKPPFRYLHDMIMEISKNTGFFKGLYSGKELDSKREWSREDKIAFFQKAIDVIGFTIGSIPKARPSKIIAGAEADKTNEFLQLIGTAISKKLDSSEAVQKVLKGEKPSSDKKGTKEDDKKTETKNISDKQMQDQPSEHEKENEVPAKSDSLDASDSQPEVPPSFTQERPQHRPGTRRKARETQENNESKRDNDLPSSDGSGSGSQVHLTVERPSTAKGQRKTVNNEQQQAELTGIVPKQSPSPPPVQQVQNGSISLSTRPSSARPPAPRIVKRVLDSEEPGSRVDSGQERKIPNVILDQKNDEEKDDDEDFVIQESVPLPPSDIESTQSSAIPEGALTKTLMAAREKYKGGEEAAPTPHSVTITEAQRKRERELVQKEVSKLQNSIQSLCQTANPLGKIMDYVQEDLDSMEQELQMWKNENSQHAESLRREERITEDELTPLRAQLEEILGKINEQYDLISACKATLLKNDKHINQMLSSLNTR